MTSGYVDQHDGVYMVAGTRVSLDSIVHAFVSGQSAEAIAQAFPVLTLEQVYGAIAFYLAHRADVERYLEGRRRDYDEKRDGARNADPMFYQKLADAKRQTPPSASPDSAHQREALFEHPPESLAGGLLA